MYKESNGLLRDFYLAYIGCPITIQSLDVDPETPLFAEALHCMSSGRRQSESPGKTDRVACRRALRRTTHTAGRRRQVISRISRSWILPSCHNVRFELHRSQPYPKKLVGQNRKFTPPEHALHFDHGIKGLNADRSINKTSVKLFQILCLSQLILTFPPLYRNRRSTLFLAYIHDISNRRILFQTCDDRNPHSQLGDLGLQMEDGGVRPEA